MTEIDINALAASIPTWKVCERFFPDVPVVSTQDHPGAPEVIVWPEGFDAPSDQHLLDLKRQLAEEQIASRYRRDRAQAFAERPIGDQLDAIIKGLKAARASGVDLPDDTDALINWSDAVKTAHPKPVGGSNG